jgi:hypothetical protein
MTKENYMAKSFDHYYEEFKGYCNTLSNIQLENVVMDEKARHKANPDDDCYKACYEAAKAEMEKRGLLQL